MNFFRSIFGKSADEAVKPTQVVEAGPDPVMAALAELEVKRLRQALAAVTPPPPPPAPPSEPDQYAARPSRVVKTKTPLPTGATGPSQNIWDLDEREPARVAPAAAAPPPRPQAYAEPVADDGSQPRRPTRNRTRILGFDAQPTAIVPLFDEAEQVAAAAPEPATPAQPTVMFPAGWLAVIEGPGRGAAFALTQGVSQIGRGADQTVALDFGDMAISRQNHAAVRYDSATHRFQIGHGGKSNLVRLNGKPLLATETLADGDEIQIGETTLLLKVLCTA
ncbi:MAG: hypothetical protein B7Z31_03045, partial [Rhodobacterales bacterium 12-65-15]